MKRLISLTLLFFLLAFFPHPPASVYAAGNCNQIGPDTVIRWDSDILAAGQIGRLTILKDTPLYKMNGATTVTVKVLKHGGTYRIYAFKPGSLSVGGGLFVKRDERIRYETPSKEKLSQLKCKLQAIEKSRQTIQINNTYADVTNRFGKEKRTSANEYNLNWYTYHQGYQKYYMASYLNNRVAGLFTMDPAFNYQNIHIGSSASDVKNSLGTPAQGILKGNINYILANTKEVQTFYQKGNYITVFYDNFNQGKVTGIQIIASGLETRKDANYGEPSAKLQAAFEMQMFDLLNAARVANGRKALSWDTRARQAAWKHSLDMAVNHYFDHDNKDGVTPFQRMEAEGIHYKAAGENIAMGYSSSIFAHEAFMNSLGHRENILNPFYTFVGVGVQFQTGTKCPFFTQDYFTP